MRLTCIALLLACTPLAAEEQIEVCFNYGCLGSASVVYDEPRLAMVRIMLGKAQDAAEERQQISLAIGRLLAWAGEQSPIYADRGGNYADDAVYGRMDCIDHATTTTRLLTMLARRGMLRWHRVLEPVLRRPFLVFDHWSAVIEVREEKESPGDADQSEGLRDGAIPENRRYVVDSWFFDNGHPAVVMPLESWMKGEGPYAE